MKARTIVFLVVIAILFFGSGYIIGFYKGVDWCVEKAVYFLKVKGIELDMDADQIASAMIMYKNNINQCYPTIKT